MKVLLVLFCAGLVSGHANYLERKLQDFVRGHLLGQFQYEERVLIAQLIATAQRFELEEFISLVGFQPILKLLSDLPFNLSHDFARYLTQALEYENMNPLFRPPLRRPHLLNIIENH